MKVKILGCSGGIGGAHLRTTSILVDHDVLIDAGTGVGDLAVDQLARIDHVFITHSHLDHIACLPLLIDTVTDVRETPLTVYATEPVIQLLRQHIFNWNIWPDFSTIPNTDSPFLCFQEIQLDRAVDLSDGRRITPWPANHTVPAVSYLLESASAALVFSGDTASCPELWDRVNRLEKLRYLIVECAFPNRLAQLAADSKHLCPATLAQELSFLQRPAELFITHLKPALADLTMKEVCEAVAAFKPRKLQHNQVFEL